MTHATLLFFSVLITAQLFTSTSSVKCNSTDLKSISPAVLIFGDSTVDTGNNDYIVTAFKGNHPPYGQNFPGRVATGRFSNGKLLPDFLAASVGLKETVPPYLDPSLSDEDVVSGVSFASAGSGYDNLTTSVSAVIPMSKQIEYFKSYVQRLEGIVGEGEAEKILSESIVVISAGINDFIFNFYDLPTRRIQFNVQQYQDFLQSNLQNYIKELYDIGLRKMVVAGLPPLGCLPIQLTLKLSKLRSCIVEENEDSKSYNDKLEKLLPRIEEDLQGSRIIYAEIYDPLMDMINNPQKYGFEETNRGCCGSGFFEIGPLCTPLVGVCPNPEQYVFWDSSHPTESTYTILFEKLKTLIPMLFDSDAC